MRIAIGRCISSLALLAIALFTLVTTAGATTIFLRSGNAPAGSADPQIRMLALPGGCGIGFPTAFTALDFAAADAGPQAVVESFIHPAWSPTLSCDPSAQWIGTNAQASPQTALFSQTFIIPGPCCFTKAYMDFCWMVDDALGDSVNPAGVYVNGVPVAAVAGGNFASTTFLGTIDVTALVHCGVNTLYVYDRDIGCAVSGVNYHAAFNLVDCITPTHGSTWGAVKAIYR